MMTLSNRQARRALVALHFNRPEISRLSGVDQVVAHVRARGSVQFDPLDVVGRNPDLVLQSRIRDYHPALLTDALYRRRALIDGYDKCLCIFPAEDYPALKYLTAAGSDRYRSAAVVEACVHVLAKIHASGVVCSDDFDSSEKTHWPWGPTKVARAALETLWMDGRLILHHRKGARRYFDLIERHLSSELIGAPDPNHTAAMRHRWHIARRVGSAGLLWNRASDALIGTRMKKAERDAAFEALTASGTIVPIAVEGLGILYARADDIPLIEHAASEAPEPVARVIAPLDNFLWDRKLIEALFGFRYRWEVYVPAAQREYGYYVLPVLLGDRLVARFEPNHHRGGALSIKSWWWEDQSAPDAAMRQAVDACLAQFEAYLKRRYSD